MTGDDQTADEKDGERTPWSFVGPKGPVDRPEIPPSAAPGDEAEAPSAPRRRRWVVPAALLAGALVAGSVAFIASGRTSEPGHPEAWSPRVLELVRFVERERKLSFKHPVHVDFLGAAEFMRRTNVAREITDDNREDLRRAAGELRAFGLITGNIDVERVITQLSIQGTVGIYIPKDKRVYVRGVGLTPKVRGTLVHELVHALQDQWFDLRKIQREQTNDTGVVSLIEGDAVRIEEIYAQSLSPAEAEEYVTGERENLDRANLGGIPRFFLQSFSFPYVFGPAFVTTLLGSTTSGALDAAFRKPPTTEAEIINPRLYLDGTVVEVEAPTITKPDKAVGEPVEFGLVTAVLVLGARLGYQPAWTALTGWQGDSSRSYLRDGRDCVAVAIRMDNSQHTAALAAAAARWATEVKQATVTTSGQVVEVRTCDPGGDQTYALTAMPDPFDVLRVRSVLLAGLVERGGLDARRAACGADAVIQQLGPELAVAVESGSATAEQVRHQQEVAAAAAAKC